MSVISKALAKAYQRDPDATTTLLRLAVADIPVVDDPAAYADHMAGVIAGRVAIAKRGLGRAYVSSMVDGRYPDDEMITKTAHWLADLDRFAADLAGLDIEEIGKAGYETWSSRGQKTNWRGEVNRDARGRFATSARPGGKRDKSYFANQMRYGNGRKVPTGAVGTMYERTDSGGYDYKSDADREAADQWIGNYASAVEQGDDMQAQARQLGLSTKNARPFVVLERDGGEKRRLAVGSEEFKQNGWGNDFYAGDTPIEIGMDFDNPADAQRISAYNALGGVLGPQAAAATVGNQENWLRFAQTVGQGAPGSQSSEGQRRSRTDSMFERAGALGDALSNVPGAGGVSDVLSTVGAAGPAIDEALRPAIERTAGRYQGKEIPVDEGLANALTGQEMAQANAAMSSDVIRGEYAAAAAGKDLSAIGSAKGQGQTKRGLSLAEGSVLFNMQRYPDSTGDQAQLAVRADQATDYFVEQLPKPSAAELSRLSGQILPSQGVAIDSGGKPVQQSQGLTDDHYLPFTMKGLKALDGGQYVRTRVNGGMTNEDVRTLLTSGARKATVVSRSGVFSLELDPNAQGSTKNAQLSQRMADNYARILDAVSFSEQYLRDLPAETKLRLESEVKAANPYVEDQSQLAALVDERMNKERADQEKITYEEMQTLDADAQAEAQSQFGGAATPAQVSEIRARKEDELRKTKTMRLRLNAEGYAAALQTLQAQFPYLIREASFEPLDQFYASRGQSEKAQAQARAIQSVNAEDMGYVGIGETRARTGVKGVKESRLPKNVTERRARAEENAPGEGDEGAKPAEGAPGAPAGQQTTEGESKEPGAALTPSSNAPLDQLVAGSSEQLGRKMIEKGKAFNGFQSLLHADPNFQQQGAPVGGLATAMGQANNAQFLRAVLLQPDANALSQAFDMNQVRTAEAFADRDAIASLVGQTMAANEASQLFEEGGALAEMGGAKSTEEAVSYISDAAREIADLAFIQGGLFTSQTNALASNPANKTGKAMEFPDIAKIKSSTELRSYLQSDEVGAQAAREGLAQLKVTDSAGGFLPLTTVGKKVHDRVRGMSAVDASRRALSAGNTVDTGMVLEQMRQQAGNVSEEAFAEAAGIPDYNALVQLDPGEAAAELNNTKTNEEMASEAEELQRGLAVYTSARALQLLGGGVDPKVLFRDEGVVVKRGPLELEPWQVDRLTELDQAQEMWEQLTAPSVG